MRHHSLHVLGNEVSFTAQVDPEKVERARLLLEERFARLEKHGSHLSKEKLLIFLALALADDYLVLQDDKAATEQKLIELLNSVECSVSR